MVKKNTERYPSSHRFDRMGRRFTYCTRKRCTETMDIVEDTETKELMHDYTTVVVSQSGGDAHTAFCSDKCAAQWLLSEDRH